MKLETKETGIIIPGGNEVLTEGGIFLPPPPRIIMSSAPEIPREFAGFNVLIIGAEARS